MMADRNLQLLPKGVMNNRRKRKAETQGGRDRGDDESRKASDDNDKHELRSLQTCGAMIMTLFLVPTKGSFDYSVITLEKKLLARKYLMLEDPPTSL